MGKDEQVYFDRMKAAIKQAIDGNVIRITGDFKNEDEFFDWLANQQPEEGVRN